MGIAATATYLPRRWMPAAEIAAAADLPEWVIRDKFGLRGKHVAADDEHASDLAVSAGEALFAGHDVDPGDVDAVVYFGSTWKDHAVWHAAPHIAERLGCRRAFALELDYVSCGAPVALRVCRDMLVAEPDLHTVLAVAGSRESYLVDFSDTDARLTFGFGDGAVAALLVADHPSNHVLGAHMVTEGSFASHVRATTGGSVGHREASPVRQALVVTDPLTLKHRLDPITMDRFIAAADGAAKRSGVTLGDVSYLCGMHMKRSMHDALVTALGVDPDRAALLDDTGHMSGIDPLLALDRAARAGVLADGDLALLLAAGTGYTWAAAVVRWGYDDAR